MNYSEYGNKIQNLFHLDNKVVVITGGAGLLGEQHAEAVHLAGGLPILLDISKKKLKLTKEKIQKKYSIQTETFKVDITNENAVRSNCNEILNKYGKIDALINNATINPSVNEKDNNKFSRLEEFSLESWNKEIAVGLSGAFLCSKYYGTEISRNQKGGAIINISSDLGLISPDQRLYSDYKISPDKQPVKPITYSIIKTGLIGMTRYLATYWPEKVRCNAICPGGVETDQPVEFKKKLISRIPLGRMAKTDEYQGVIVFLLSEASTYMNGAVIPMEGGRCVW